MSGKVLEPLKHGTAQTGGSPIHQQPVTSTPRAREFAWAILALLLFAAYIDGGTSELIVEEAKQKAQQHAQIYSVVTEILNKPRVIRIGEEVVAECKPVHQAKGLVTNAAGSVAAASNGVRR